jgi:class 3 adenylate cyclase
VARIFTADQLAGEAGVNPDRIEWLVNIGILEPSESATFSFGDVSRVKLVTALLQGGFTSDQVEWAVSEGHLDLDRFDEYPLVVPSPRSERTFAEFMAEAGPRGSLLPAVYAALGLTEPAFASPISTDEEERLQRFLRGWDSAPSEETLIRAARLVAEGARMAAQGWSDLIDEQLVDPAKERLYRGEIERFPEAVRESYSTLLRLLPSMMEWLMDRYEEQRRTADLVEGFEEFFAARGLGPPLPPTAFPAVVFVDLSEYTRLTEERGDEAAAGYAASLQRESEAVAAANEGRLVKLLGDGAMLQFPDAERGLNAALALVQVLSKDGRVAAHAGVHAGPVIERDLDLFGRTVNLASRLAEAAGQGEVLVGQTVRDSVHSPTVRFEPADRIVLKGIIEPGPIFRVTVDRGS